VTGPLPFVAKWVLSRKTIEPWPLEIKKARRYYILPPLLDFLTEGVQFLVPSFEFFGPKLEKDPNIAVIKEIGDKISKVVSKEFGISCNWEICLVKNRGINAVTVCGKKIFIFSGLINTLIQGEKKGIYRNAEAALAFIIAHETGHILAQHFEQQMSLILSAFALDRCLNLVLRKLLNKDRLLEELVPPFLGTKDFDSSLITPKVNSDNAFETDHIGALLWLKVFSTNLLTQKVSRECEYEADRIGVFLCLKAGYDPDNGLLDYSEPIEIQPKNQILRRLRSTLLFAKKVIVDPFLRCINVCESHPLHEARAKENKETAFRVKKQMSQRQRMHFWFHHQLQQINSHESRLTPIVFSRREALFDLLGSIIAFSGVFASGLHFSNNNMFHLRPQDNPS